MCFSATASVAAPLDGRPRRARPRDGTVLFASAMARSSGVVIDRHHLGYHVPLRPACAVGIPYVAATCGALLLSSSRFVNWFGVVTAVSMSVTVVVADQAFSSVWCFFAAGLSLVLLVHYRRDWRGETDESPEGLPWLAT